MQTLVLFAFLSLTGPVLSLTCHSLTVVATDAWCNAVCNNVPPYCPSDTCACGNSTTPSPSPGAVTTVPCVSTSSQVTNDWCISNCNNHPPFCPTSFCTCGAGVSPSPSPGAASNGTCVAIRQPANNNWCLVNCQKGYCPPEFCVCTGSLAAANATIYEAIESCRPVFVDSWCQAMCTVAPNTTQCTSCCRVKPTPTPASPLYIQKPEPFTTDLASIKMYYSLPTTVNTITVNGNTGAVLNQGICQSGFTNAMGLAIDINEGVFVADPGSSRLLYINPGCTGYTAVIPANHYIASPYDVEIMEGQGTIIVASAGRPGIYSLNLDTNHQIISYTNTGATTQLAHGLAQCFDTSGNNGFLFVEQEAFLQFFDIIKGTKTTIIGPANGIVDIKDVEYRPGCGIFFAADDNNKVFQCGVNMNNTQPPSWNSCTPNVTTCHPICNNLIDSTSCAGLISPTGLTLDCLCNSFISNKGQGNLVGFTQTGTEFIYTNTVYGNDLDYVGPNFCQPGISRSITPSPSRAPTPSPSPSPTTSPTPSPSFSALSLRIFMFSSVGSCVGGCSGPTGFKQMALSVAVSIIDKRIGGGSYLATDPAAAQCTSAGGTSAFIGTSSFQECQIQQNMDTDIFNWSLSQFGVYSPTSTSTNVPLAKWPPPSVINPIAIYGPGVYPNQDSAKLRRTVAASVNCTSDWNGRSFRFVWTPQVGGICYTDAGLGRTVCFDPVFSPLDNSLFHDLSNNVMSDNSVWRSDTC